MPETTNIGSIDGWIGHGLHRPECVVAHQSGLLLVPTWRDNGGCSLINESGETHHILACRGTAPLRPNGIALENNGTVLLAHLGEDDGGIYRLHHDGAVEPVVTTANAKALPPTNFVVQDSSGRLWITVSTRKSPRAKDYRKHAASGFIAVAEPGCTNATIVADKLGYTNECVIDEENARVYVNETFARRLTVFDMQNGRIPRLSSPRVCCSFGAGTYPDGLALDTQGNLWVTSIISNRIVKVAPNGQSELMFEDSINSHIGWTESAYQSDQLASEHLGIAGSAQVQNISNLAFAGASRSRLYLGNLLGDSLPYIDTAFCGVAMTHWDVELGALARYL